MQAQNPAPAQVLKNALVKALRAERDRWLQEKERLNYDECTKYLWWSHKAKESLFYEAANVVSAAHVDDAATVEDAKTALLAALDNHSDWGWGENWSDDIHRRTLQMINDFVAKHLAQGG